MKDARAAWTGPQTYGAGTGIPVSVANRIAAMEKAIDADKGSGFLDGGPDSLYPVKRKKKKK